MDIGIINSGAVHAIPRAIAISKYINVKVFIETGNKSTSHKYLTKNKIETIFFDSAGSHSFIKLNKLLKNLKIDLLICNFALGTHFYSSILSLKIPIAVIVMGHDLLNDEGDSQVSSIEKQLVIECLKKCDFIFAKSEYLISRLHNRSIKNNIYLNYWGISFNNLVKFNKKEIRKQLHLPQDKILILSMRAFEPRCNIDIVTQSFINLRKINDNFEIIYLGQQVVSEYYIKIKKLLAENNCSDAAHFYLNQTFQDVLYFYSACDVAVSIAKSDGFPNSVLELMAMKVPLIVGEIPHVKELLNHKKNSVLCTIDTIDLENKIQWVLSDTNKTELEYILDNGADTVMKFGDLDNNAQMLAGIIQKKKTENRKHKSIKIIFLFLMLRALNKISLTFSSKFHIANRKKAAEFKSQMQLLD